MTDENKIPDYYGKGGRLKSEAHPALVESAYRHECSDRLVLSPFLHDADLAHALALIQAGVIPKANAPVLLSGLLELDSADGGLFEVDERLGDLYNSKDAALRKKIGDDAGWLHAGRPRREAINIAYLMACRERIVEGIAEVGRLGMAFVAKAEEWKEVLMPDFTYLQPAHPTNLGHYLLTFASPLVRDLRRLQSSFEEFDSSPAGSGSTNGTRLPIDRHYLAGLLGFTEVAGHTRDAMWQPDVPVNLLGNLSCAMVNIGRFAEELQLWVSAAFDFVGFDDGFFRSSVIMPHKRNPYAMAYIRGVNGWLTGQVSSAASLGKTYSGNPDSRFFLYGMVPEALEKVSGSFSLMTALLESMQPNQEKMAAALNEHFLQATDLAELMMELGNVDYRSAHQIAGKLSAEVAEGTLGVSDITQEKLCEVALEVIGVRLELTDEKIGEALDHTHLVRSRKSYGAAAPERVSELSSSLRAQFQTSLEWASQQKTSIEQSRNTLREKAKQIANHE